MIREPWNSNFSLRSKNARRSPRPGLAGGEEASPPQFGIPLAGPIAGSSARQPVVIEPTQTLCDEINEACPGAADRGRRGSVEWRGRAKAHLAGQDQQNTSVEDCILVAPFSGRSPHSGAAIMCTVGHSRQPSIRLSGRPSPVRSHAGPHRWCASRSRRRRRRHDCRPFIEKQLQLQLNYKHGQTVIRFHRLISASGSPAARAFIQARQRSTER